MKLIPHWSPFAVAVIVCWALTQPVSAVELLPADQSVQTAIDHYLNAKLSSAGVTSAAPADDATWARRLTLDLAGRIPTPRELHEFIHSNSPTKCDELIDR